MKKKLLTTVLTVGVVLSLVGCGAKETTSSESVAETTEITTEYGTEETTVEEVVEETTVDETEAEVVEEPAKERIPVDITDGASFMNQVIENFNAQKYVVFEWTNTLVDSNDPTVKSITETEFLYNWDSNIACLFTKEGDIMYLDYANNISYGKNANETGFYKFPNDGANLKELFDAKYHGMSVYVELGGNFVVTELEAGDYTGNYCATVQYDAADNQMYVFNCYVDPYTLLPVSYTVTLCDKNKELVLEDGTTVSGEYFMLGEDVFNFQFLTEDAGDFATFQSATTLPADDECTLVEGETTTTE